MILGYLKDYTLPKIKYTDATNKTSRAKNRPPALFSLYPNPQSVSKSYFSLPFNPNPQSVSKSYLSIPFNDRFTYLLLQTMYVGHEIGQSQLYEYKPTSKNPQQD